MSELGQARPVPPFLKDVVINVIANILAAAIVYLAGVMLGLFPKSPQAIVAALTLLSTTVMFFLMIMFMLIPAVRRFDVPTLATYTVAATGIAVGVTAFANGGEIAGAISILSGAGVATINIFLDLQRRRRRRELRERLRAPQPIKGMNWIAF